MWWVTFWQWATGGGKPAGQCRYCENTLVRCPSCRGDWRVGCPHCGVGLVCPEHRAFWLV